jgi:hypothetical protein
MASLLQMRLLQGDVLAQFLNGARPAKARRIIKLLEIYRELSDLLPTIPPGERVREGPRAGARVYDLNHSQRARDLITAFDATTARFRYRHILDRYLFRQAGEPAYLPIRMACTNPGKFSRLERTSITEDYAIELALELAKVDFLRIERCAACGTWFMRRAHQKNCSAKCRKARYRQAHRAEWNRYMRTYRTGRSRA